MELNQGALDKFYDYVEAAYKEIVDRPDAQVVAHYSGDLNYGFANALTTRIEKILTDGSFSKKVQRRFFSVFVEAVQNIRLHGVSDNENHVHAGVTVFTLGGKLCTKFLNIIYTDAADGLAKRYDEVNGMDRKELKEKYMDVMMHGNLSAKGGAGLGIITLVMRSRNPGPYQIHPISEHFGCFECQITVDPE